MNIWKEATYLNDTLSALPHYWENQKYNQKFSPWILDAIRFAHVYTFNKVWSILQPSTLNSIQQQYKLMLLVQQFKTEYQTICKIMNFQLLQCAYWGSHKNRDTTVHQVHERHWSYWWFFLNLWLQCKTVTSTNTHTTKYSSYMKCTLIEMCVLGCFISKKMFRMKSALSFYWNWVWIIMFRAKIWS